MFHGIEGGIDGGGLASMLVISIADLASVSRGDRPTTWAPLPPPGRR